MKPACLIIDEMHESIVPLLQEANMKADYRPEIKREEILEIVDRYEGLIVRSKTTIDKEILDKATKLKFIARAGAGIDKVDQELVKTKGIHLLNAPEGNRDAVAEHALGMLLCLMNHICRGDREVREGIWDREGNRGFEIMGKTVGIIGFGFMGQAFAQRLSGFGCKVLAYDNAKSNYGNEYAREASLEQIQKEADIVSFHIPLNDANRLLVNESYLDAFEKPFYLVNTARGGILKLADLLKMLDKGKVRAAALDVLENEKLHTLTDEQKTTLQGLKDSGKVLFTPHVGGWTFESYEKINTTLVDKIKQLGLS